MRPRSLIGLTLIAAVALFAWRAELYTVARPGEVPRPLSLQTSAQRTAASLDVVLPAVPAGMQHLISGREVLLIHYWAPWERHGRDQAVLLDSLVRLPELEPLRTVVVCFDPFPSVARFVARHRLRLNVLLDGQAHMRKALPCPSVPYTYVLDRSGRIAIAQAGEVDWWAPQTRDALLELLSERTRATPASSTGT